RAARSGARTGKTSRGDFPDCFPVIKATDHESAKPHRHWDYQQAAIRDGVMESRSLRVSAVQMVSENGDRRANLARAGHLVQEAADAGAKLVALPELFSGGYWLNEQAWDTAEPEDGPTEAWLRETAQRHGIYLGGSYLQAHDDDFVNVFSLATPTGQIAGRVPKQKAA